MAGIDVLDIHSDTALSYRYSTISVITRASTPARSPRSTPPDRASTRVGRRSPTCSDSQSCRAKWQDYAHLLSYPSSSSPMRVSRARPGRRSLSLSPRPSPPAPAAAASSPRAPPSRAPPARSARARAPQRSVVPPLRDAAAPFPPGVRVRALQSPRTSNALARTEQVQNGSGCSPRPRHGSLHRAAGPQVVPSAT